MVSSSLQRIIVILSRTCFMKGSFASDVPENVGSPFHYYLLGSLQMFQDENTYRIHRDMSSIRHPCRTIQVFVGYCSLMSPAVVLLPRWNNNHYPMPGLKVVINLYKLALLPTPSIDKAFQ